MENKQPATFADIRLYAGEQGGGKTTILVAYPVEDYYTHMDGLKSPSGEIIKAKSVARAVNREDYQYMRKAGIYPNILKYARVYSEDGSHSKLIKIPKDHLVLSPVHIFSNLTLYGVKYGHIGIADIIQYINTPMFNGAWILSDESGMTDSRSSMEATGKLGAQFYATVRKRQAKFCVAAQYNEMVERRIRLFATTRVLCSYDEETYYITCDVKKRGEEPFTTDFYEPRYRPFFDTNELPTISQKKIDRALESIYSS